MTKKSKSSWNFQQGENRRKQSLEFKNILFDVHMRCFRREEREFQKEPRGLKPRLGCCPELPGHGAGSCLQSPLGRHTVPCGACFHPPVQQKSEGEMNTLSDVFAELRPEEIEKPPSQYGTGFTECAGPHVKGTLPGRSQKGWPLGGTSRVRNGGRHAQPPDTAGKSAQPGVSAASSGLTAASHPSPLSPCLLFLSGRKWPLQVLAF